MSKLKYLAIFFFIFSVSGCIDYNKRIIVRTLRIDKEKYIEWYYYSLISGNSPDYIDVKLSNGESKHIFIRHYICDIAIIKDTLFITAYKGIKPIFFEKSNVGLKVKVDSLTNCTRSTLKIRE